MNGDDCLLHGLACPWDSLSVPLRDDSGTYCEQIQRGAFAESLRPGHDIRIYWDHDPRVTLASRADGTLTLWESDNGLEFLADLQGKTYGGFWLALEAGKIVGASVGMLGAVKLPVRAGVKTVIKARLPEISLVETPAYRAWVQPEVAPQRDLRQLARDVARGDFNGDTSTAHFRRAIALERAMDEWKSTALYRQTKAKFGLLA